MKITIIESCTSFFIMAFLNSQKHVHSEGILMTGEAQKKDVSECIWKLQSPQNTLSTGEGEVVHDYTRFQFKKPSKIYYLFVGTLYTHTPEATTVCAPPTYSVISDWCSYMCIVIIA